MTDYNELVRGLAAARGMTTYWQDQLADVKLAIAESELGQEQAKHEESLKRAKEWEAAARSALDQAVLASFDGNKHPHPAITVKELTKLDYDPKQAREWADTNLRSALVLDAKRFEKAILATEVPDFVTVRKEQQVTVASDLSPYVI